MNRSRNRKAKTVPVDLATSRSLMTSKLGVKARFSRVGAKACGFGFQESQSKWEKRMAKADGEDGN